jgi:hypothetical protein
MKVKVAVCFGLNAPEDGNGLRDFVDILAFCDVKCFRQDEKDKVIDFVAGHVGPLVLIGHSFGGSLVVDVANSIVRDIDYMVLIDPVSKGWAWTFGISSCTNFTIPNNVMDADCWRRSDFFGPPASKIINECSSYRNRDKVRSTSHASICHSELIRFFIFKKCKTMVK